MRSFTYLKKGKKRCEMRRAKEKGASRKVIGALAAVILCFFLLYGVSPLGEKGLSFGFSAFAYTITCSISGMSAVSGNSYIPSSTSLYYNSNAGGSFSVGVSVSTNDPSGTNYTAFPTTVSAGGVDYSSPYSLTYTWNTSDVSDYLSQNASCVAFWGNTNKTDYFNIYNDNTAPSTTINAYEYGTSNPYTLDSWTNKNITIQDYICSDSESGCKSTYICSSLFSCVPTSLMSLPADYLCAAGTVCMWNVSYTSTDNVNNVETTITKKVKIDLQYPTTTINPNGQSCNASNTSVTLSCDDGSGSGCSGTIKYKIVDSGVTCNSSSMSTYSSAINVGCASGSNCSQKICTYSTDSLGNEEPIATSNIYYIDFAGPSTPTGLSPGAGTCTATAAPALSWNAASDVGCSSVAGYQVELYSSTDCSGTAIQTGTPSSASWTPTALSTGAYSWRVKAKDALNNWGNWSSCTTLSIDITPPNPNPATIASITADSISQITVTATSATDVGCSGTVNYLLSRISPSGNTGWQAGASWIDSGRNCNTKYNYTVQTRDGLSNTGTASGESSKYTLVAAPGTPTVAPLSATSLNVSWTSVCANNNPQYYANETSYNPGATDYNWGTAKSYTDSGLNCFSQYTYQIKARNNESAETSYSSTTSKYPIDYIGACSGTGSSGKCWTGTTCYYIGTGCPSTTTMCSASSAYCKGSASSTCNSGNINTCCYNVACNSGGTSGSTDTDVNSGVCTCSGGNCDAGTCYNSATYVCYSGITCGASGWASSTTDSAPSTPTSPSATPACAGASTTINALGIVSDSDAESVKLQVCKEAACTNILCNSTAVASGTNATCTFTASSACSSTGTCTIYLRTLENISDACGNTKNSSTTSTTFNYDISSPTTSINPDGRAWAKTNVSGVNLSASPVGCASASGTYYKNVSSGTTCDNTGMSTYSSLFNVTCPADSVCIRKVCYYSNDSLGNTESVQTSSLYYIDAENPTCSVSSISEDSGAQYQYVSGTTIYYGNSGSNSGSFTVNISSSDSSGSGVSSVYFPDTVSVGINDSSSPYSLQYSWDSSDSYSQAATINVYDNVNNTNTCTFTVTRDITAPSGGSVTYYNGTTAETNQQINVSAGTDSGSGLATAQLYRQSATLTETTCGSYGGFSAVGNSSTSKTYVIDTLGSGYCYKYIYNATDNVENMVSYSSSNEIKVDTSTPAIIFVSPTDVDGAKVSRNWTYINITSDKALNYSNLEWNGSNESMSGSGTNWYKNKTLLAQGTYSYKVYGEDLFNNLGVSQTRTITIDWTAPSTSIIPNSQSCNSTQPTVNLSCSDALAGCNTTYYKIVESATTCNTTGMSTYSSSISVTCAPGAYCSQKICAYSTDLAANSESIVSSGNYQTDLFGPSVPGSLSPANASWTKDSTPELSWSASSDNGCSAVSSYNITIYSDLDCTIISEINSTSITRINASVLPEGKSYWKVRAIDALGNIGNSSNCTEIQVDLTSPGTTATATSPPGVSGYTFNTWTASDAQINLTCSDASGSGCGTTDYCMDNANSCTPGVSYNAVYNVTCASGSICTNYTRYNSTDSVGNTETTKSSTIKIDKENPSTTIIPNGQACTAADISINLTCSDGSGSGCAAIYYKVVDSTTSCDTSGMSTYSANFSVGCASGTDCVRKVCAYSADSVGNSESVETSSNYSIDETGPNAPAGLTPADYTETNDNTTTFQWSIPSDNGCSGTISGYNITIYSDSGCTAIVQTSAPASNTYTSTELAQGEYWWKVRAKDSLSNWGAWSACTKITIDVTAPTTNATATSPPGESSYTFNTWTSNDVQITLSCSDASGSGCETTEYCVDTLNSCTPATEYVSAFDISSENISYVRYRSIDSAGNTESTLNKTVKVDKNAPSTTATAVKEDGSSYTFGNWEVTSYINITLTCADPISGCGTTQYCTDGTNSCTPNTTYSLPVQISTQETTYVRYNSTDNIGNTETTVNQTAKIDNTAPTTSFVPNSQSCSQVEPFINLTCEDGLGIGCNATYYKIVDSGVACNTTGTSAYSETFNITCAPGTYCSQKICAYSTDNLTNTETITNSGNYLIDFAGPNAPTGLSPADNTMTRDSTPTLSWTAPSDVGCAGVSEYNITIYSNALCTNIVETSTSSSLNYTSPGLEENDYWWTVSARDSFGNWGSKAGCIKLIIHTTGPSCSVSSINESSSFAYVSGTTIYYNNKSSGSYNITADLVDSGSGISNATFPDTTSAGGADSSAPYEWQYNWNSLDSYSQISTINAYDTLGNTETCQFTVALDNSNPEINILGAPSAWQSASASINLSCSDSGSGCNSSMTYYYINGTGAYCPEFSISEYIQYSSPVVISSNSWFCGYAVDNVNNSNLSSPTEILVDQVPPTSSIISPDAGSWFSSDFNVSIDNSDTGGSGLNKCYYKVVSNGTETLPYTEYACNSNITITVGPGMNCQHQGVNACEVYVYATDNAANTGSASSRQFSIELTAPVIMIVDPGCSNGQFAVDYSISNVGSGLSSCSYEWSVNGNSWNSTGFSSGTCLEGDYSVNFNSSLCRNNDFGSCTIRINATTIASSTGSGNLSISVDNKAPTISIDSTSSTSGWYKNGSIMNVTASVAANGCMADSCYYALSNDNGTNYGSWNSMPCNSVQPFESGMDCTEEGIDKCRVKVYANESAHQGNEAEMPGAWDIDFTAPETTDDVASPAWDNWIVYMDTYYATYYSNITLNCSDSASGCESTYYCTYSPGNESQCTPATESASNPTMLNVSCPFNSVCTKAVRYYSTDTAGNYENVKESPVVYIVSNSYVNNTNVSNSQIVNESDIRYSNIENSIVDGCYVRNSIIINSSIVKNPDYTTQCRIIDSVIINSEITSSEIMNSEINNSVFFDSRIEDSKLFSDLGYYTLIRGTEPPCGGFGFVISSVRANVLIAGYARFGDYVYYAPKNLSEVCTGMLPRPVGILSAVPSIVNNGTTITLTYVGNDVGFSVEANYSALDYNNGTVYLLDNGIPPDLVKDDALYTANITVNMDGDGEKVLIAKVNDNVRNVFYVNATVILDNTKPNAVVTINGGDAETATRHVVLSLSYSDANGVKQCRYSNEDLNWTDWEPCSSTKAWVLSAGNGTKTVNYEVMDNAGNNQSDLDIITLQEGAYDLTPPTNLIVTDDGDYTNSATTLHARWSAFDRESKVFYLYRINSSGSCVPIDGSCGWQDALDSTEATVTNLSLEEGHTYRFCVIAQNAYFINSSEVCSDGIIVDLTPPEISSLYSSFAEGVWTNSSSPYFSWNATDPVSAGVSSGVYAYSYLLDENSNTTPDIVPEGDLGALANETYRTYSSLVDGVHYFHVRARDAAGNWGAASHYEIKSDITPPTIPFMLSPNQSTNSSTITFNWEPSTDYSSGVAGYYITITRADTGEYLADNLWIGNVTHYDASAINGITYHASVKAKDSAGNIGLDSDLAGGTYDNQAPIILFKKPSNIGKVVSNQPILTIDTNEIATCYYEGVIFAYTDSTHHEAKVTVLNGQSPSFNITCMDLVGNQASASISFTVDSTLVATGVNVSSLDSLFYANLPASFVIEAESAVAIMGEIPKDRFSVLINGTRIDDFVVKDNGGNYTITFLAPAVEGTYSVVFKVDSAQSSAAAMPVQNLNMIITYDGSLSGTVTNDKMAYSDESSHIVGIASDSRDVSASGSSAQLQVVAESSGNAYIFVTRQGENPGSRENYLKSQKFIGLPSPSFGYRVNTDKYIINTELKYKDIAVSSDRSIGPGAHTLVIRNNGLTPDGKVNVTISTD